MLDGQYAFASDSAGTNFAADRSIAPTLIVAIDNLRDDRFLQYMPQTIYDRSDAPVRAVIDREVRRVGKSRLVSSAFIGFLETQLKPFVDTHYRTSADRLTAAKWQRGCNLQTRVYQAGHAFAETAAQMDEVLAWLLA